MTKKGVEAWWGFLAGALIIAAVIVLLFILYKDIKIASLMQVGKLGDKLGGLFK